MGLRGWLAKNVAGAAGYASAVTHELVAGGLALGRTLYLGHGTRTTAADVIVFDDSVHLRSAGFSLYCSDDLRRPPMEDDSEFSKQTRVAGLAFAIQCGITAAQNFMKAQNASAFIRSLGSETKVKLGELKSGIAAELISQYLQLPTPDGITQVLNFDKPGTDDRLSVFLQAAARHSQDVAVGFSRGGTLGFDVVAIPIAEETVTKINTAATKFGW